METYQRAIDRHYQADVLVVGSGCMGQCMSMGQAAGTAAALSLRLGCLPADLPITQLQHQLRALGALLEG